MAKKRGGNKKGLNREGKFVWYILTIKI